jgi:hypothetical protein
VPGNEIVVRCVEELAFLSLLNQSICITVIMIGITKTQCWNINSNIAESAGWVINSHDLKDMKLIYLPKYHLEITYRDLLMRLKTAMLMPKIPTMIKKTVIAVSHPPL